MQALRTLTEERVLQVLEAAFPWWVDYQTLHAHTHIKDPKVLVKATRRLEELGFIKSGRGYNAHHRGRGKKVFILNGPVREIAINNILNAFYQNLPEYAYLYCRINFPQLTHKVRVGWIRQCCMNGCGLRIQCYADNKERVS